MHLHGQDGHLPHPIINIDGDPWNMACSGLYRISCF